jgi:MFS family permease
VGLVNRDRTPGWGVLLFAAVAIGVANSVVYGLLGNLQDTYGFGDAGLGLIAGVGLVANFVSQLTLAPIADRGHTRAFVTGGLALAFVGSVLFAVSSTLPLLVFARAVVGVSNGLFAPASRSIAASISPTRAAERMGTLSGVEFAGFIVGPLIGGVLVEPLGVRWPFALCGIGAGIGALVISRLTLPEPPRTTEVHRISFDLLRRRDIQVGVVAWMALFLPVGVYDTILDRYFTDLGAPEWLIGIGFVLYGLPFALLTTMGGRLADRHGAFRLCMISLACVVPITLGYGVFASAWAMLPLFVVEGIAQALGVPAAQALVAAAAPAGRSSAAQGLAGAINQAAAATVAFASPVAYGWWGGDGTFIATAVLVLLVTLAALALQRTAPRADTDDVLVS